VRGYEGSTQRTMDAVWSSHLRTTVAILTSQQPPLQFPEHVAVDVEVDGHLVLRRNAPHELLLRGDLLAATVALSLFARRVPYIYCSPSGQASLPQFVANELTKERLVHTLLLPYRQ
jgi:hypothetical protein